MSDFIRRLLCRPKPSGSLALLAKYGIRPKGVVHVGANDGAEFEDYRRSVRRAIYVEPIPEVFAQLTQRLSGAARHYAVQALCSDVEGEEVEFNVASNDGQSSSMFAFGRHAALYPEISYVRTIRMKTRTVDSILSGYSFRNDFLVLDVQGAEIKVLRGAVGHLPHFRAIYAEVAQQPLYDGGCTLGEIIAFLETFGFRLKNLDIGPNTWGDALFIRQSRLTSFT